MTPADQVREKLAKLEQMVTAKTPGLPTLLRDIHSQLKKDAELVTLLSDEECSVLVRGLKTQTSTEIAVKAVKKGTTKPLKQLGLSDL